MVRAGGEEGFIPGKIPAADDGDNEFFLQNGQNRAQNRLQNARDDRRDDDIRRLCDLCSRFGRMDAELIGDLFYFIKMSGAGVDLFRRADVSGKQAFCNGAAHAAEADGGRGAF